MECHGTEFGFNMHNEGLGVSAGRTLHEEDGVEVRASGSWDTDMKEKNDVSASVDVKAPKMGDVESFINVSRLLIFILSTTLYADGFCQE